MGSLSIVSQPLCIYITTPHKRHFLVIKHFIYIQQAIYKGIWHFSSFKCELWLKSCEQIVNFMWNKTYIGFIDP
jgi:hypothetical protein